MSEAFPALVAYGPNAAAVDSASPDILRTTFNVRPNTGGIYAMLPSVGSGPAVRAVQRVFSNGAATDMTVDGSNTAQVFSIAPQASSLSISGVGLEMITVNNIVFSGASFGGRYYNPGLLGVGAGYFPPGALAKGLMLQVTSGGVTTVLANLTVNEDFMTSQMGFTGGSLTGATDNIRCRFEMRQPLVMGTSDQLSWTVRDNMNNNQGIVELRSYAWGQVTA